MRLDTQSVWGLAAFGSGPRVGRYLCSDGLMIIQDVAKAAGVTPKAARRAMKSYCADNEDGNSNGTGATLTLDATGVPFPETATRAEMAVHVARKLTLGRFALRQRIEDRAVATATASTSKKDPTVRSTNHPYKDGRHGRSVKPNPAGGVMAKLECSRCDATMEIPFRKLADSEAMDQKFAQKGWAVDPTRCPTHNRRNHQPRKDQAMPSDTATFAAPSPAAIAAQAKMFGLLQTHFDPDIGAYGAGWSDAKIAEDCRLSPELVAGVRKEAFGDLKVPPEVAQLTADIAALEQLFAEQVSPIQTELASLKSRVAAFARAFNA